VRGTTETGRTAEFLVCYVLQCNGIEAHHINASTDVIAILKTGKMIRIEVKGASQPVKRGHRSSYIFGKNLSDNAEWYAFVALDREAVFFVPNDMAKKGQSVTIKALFFTSDEQKRSVESIINQDGELK